MCQMYDFSRAQKLRENVTGFLELLYSGGQQCQTSSVNLDSSKVQEYCKYKVTTIPAQGTLHLSTQRATKANACRKDNVMPGCFKGGTSHIHSGGRENSKDF